MFTYINYNTPAQENMYQFLGEWQEGEEEEEDKGGEEEIRRTTRKKYNLLGF